MAHLGFARTVYKSGGTRGYALIAYITRHQWKESLAAERQLRHLGEGREDLVDQQTRNLPGWASGNPSTYFQAAEKHERVQGIAFEEWKITLPHELTRDQNRGLVGDLLEVIAGDLLPCTHAFHAPPTLHGDREQPHIHLIVSSRKNDGHARTAATHFRRYNREQPGTGGAEKDPAFWHKGAVKNHRLMIADVLNLHLELNGHSVRVHPDSLTARGIDRVPEPKLLPSESRAYREQGVLSPTMAKVFQSRQVRATQPPREQNNARLYWEQRKQFLGITRDLPHDEKLARILLKRHGSVERVPEKYRALIERPRVPQQARTLDLARQLQRLTRQVGHGSDEHAASGHLRVRLHDQERDQGLSW